jgi:hypothetical protein
LIDFSVGILDTSSRKSALAKPVDNIGNTAPKAKVSKTSCMDNMKHRFY